ncbi:MAG: zf-HC2 domain-containing protein [Planctomycetes bacterium]|nr:zf-HC2 domain-containing protein [Planctomycetota bacterium]
MHSCERYEPLIGALVDGELGRDLVADVRRHLEACARCREFERDLREMAGLWAALPVEVPRARLDLRIRPLAVATHVAAPRRRRILGPLVGVAAAGVGFLLLSLAFPSGPSEPAPDRPDPAAGHADLDAFVAETTAVATRPDSLQHDWPPVHEAIEEEVLAAYRDGEQR